MATIQIADDDARVQYTQAVVANTTQLTIDYPFFSLDDINVIVTNAAGTDTVLTRGTGTGTFAVVGVAVDDGFSGGYITLGDSYSAGTDTFTIFRDIPVQRTTDFPTSGPFNISSLNTELDKIIAIEQELETKVTRTLQLADSDTTIDLKLPNLDTRKGTTLAFNATTGVPEAGPTISGVTTVAALAADIATLADIEDGTVATDAISDTAAIASDITTVSGISSNVSAVVGNASNINAVNANSSNINTVAGINANVTTVAGISSDVTTAVGISAEITAVAGDATDIGTVSANIADVNTVAGISADVSTVAADGTDIGVVAGISSDVTTVSGISANVTTVASNTSNINAVAADATDIGTVSTNIANVNTVAGINADVTTVAGIAADVTAAATNASDISAIAAEVAKVVTVANDLNEATSEIDTVANSIANVDLVGASIADVNTVASNLSGITAFADVYASGPTDPTTNLNEGDLFFNTTSDTLKVYDGSAWVAGVTAGSGFLPLSGGQLTGNLTFSSTQTVDGRDVSADGTKLDLIEDGATADQTASELLTAVKTVDGAASGLDADLLDGQQGTYYLDANNFTNMPPSDVVGDTTPQLGGTLDVNSNDIDFGQGNKALFGGVGGDLEIYHNGTNAFIDNNDGILYIRNNVDGDDGSDIYIQAKSGENGIIVQDDGEVQLYYNGVEKLNTSSSGVTVAGTVAATSYTGDGSSLTGISAGATGGGSDQIFYENGQTVTTNYTITNGKNAMSAGPITINTGVTVTVGTGETWTVV
jgi:hypothetical protein